MAVGERLRRDVPAVCAHAACLAGDRRLGQRLQPAGHLLGRDDIRRGRGVALEAAREDQGLRPIDGRLEGERGVDRLKVAKDNRHAAGGERLEEPVGCQPAVGRYEAEGAVEVVPLQTVACGAGGLVGNLLGVAVEDGVPGPALARGVALLAVQLAPHLLAQVILHVRPLRSDLVDGVVVGEGARACAPRALLEDFVGLILQLHAHLLRQQDLLEPAERRLPSRAGVGRGKGGRATLEHIVQFRAKELAEWLIARADKQEVAPLLPLKVGRLLNRSRNGFRLVVVLPEGAAPKGPRPGLV
mmetsp:Transcript_56250/g.134880  ORF Transcript_56250/g.134880 Transcript_56250/m.134880 type:complete len:300 (+) Transcript_56250:3233-4132(+)